MTGQRHPCVVFFHGVSEDIGKFSCMEAEVFAKRSGEGKWVTTVSSVIMLLHGLTACATAARSYRILYCQLGSFNYFLGR